MAGAVTLITHASDRSNVAFPESNVRQTCIGKVKADIDWGCSSVAGSPRWPLMVSKVELRSNAEWNRSELTMRHFRGEPL
ncbi:hypothetical protein C2E31_05335 [Rhodopirellula baltica]|nr:hypothetical protein C2E31_05335 [Rhodopirellula baltica]